MNTEPLSAPRSQDPPAEYEAAMADIEHRAAQGELTLAQAKREIFELRERFAASAGVVTGWAMRSSQPGTA
jgi:hypothetical protein